MTDRVRSPATRDDSPQSAYGSWRALLRQIDAFPGVQSLRTLYALNSWAHRRTFTRWVVERRLGIPYREARSPTTNLVMLDGYRFEPRDGSADRQVLSPFHEVQTRSFVRRHFAHKTAGGIFIDVGAHCGSFSIPFESFFEKVLSVEPLPENYRALERNIVLNRLQGKIVPFNLAAGATHGPGTLFLNGDEMSSLVPMKASSRTLGVRVSPLDALLKDGGVSASEVRLLKADVEGAELQVLEGARGLLGRSSPAVILEANDAGAKARLESFMNDIGYVLLRVADGRNMCFERFFGQTPPRLFSLGLKLGLFA